MQTAEGAGLRIGCAPDTFLGPGLNTARALIDAGEIGTPVSALTLFETPGPVPDHRNLELLLTRGAGPLFDIAPYYLTARVEVSGPAGVRRRHRADGQAQAGLPGGPQGRRGVHRHGADE